MTGGLKCLIRLYLYMSTIPQAHPLHKPTSYRYALPISTKMFLTFSALLADVSMWISPLSSAYWWASSNCTCLVEEGHGAQKQGKKSVRNRPPKALNGLRDTNASFYPTCFDSAHARYGVHSLGHRTPILRQGMGLMMRVTMTHEFV